VFKTETKYALRAAAALAQSPEPLSISEIAARTQAPAPMLAKVLHRLSQHRVVVGRPGPGGGYWLARPAGEIRLSALVEITEGPDFGLECLFGLPECSDENPCPLHRVWAELRGSLFAMIENHSLADLASSEIAPDHKGRAPRREKGA
jgi:Rrf2 family protein